MLTNIAVGILLSSLMGLGGYYKRALSKSGVLGAIIVGTCIFGFGGWVWGVLLVTFFVSSSALSFFRKSQKGAVEKRFDKGSRRDIGQALANGGVGAVIALLSATWPAPLWWAAFLGSMGTVNADTWATELGILSKATPRLITTGQAVPTGTSGGITLWGTAASLAGGLIIGLVGRLLSPSQSAVGGLMVIIAGVGGLMGALLDSLLGATLQAQYTCSTCGLDTEKSICCGQPTDHRAGFAWLNNDMVNFVSSIGGATVAVGIFVLFT